MRRLNLSMFPTQLTRVREGELPLQSRKYSAFKTIARAVPNLPTTASWMKSKAMLVIVIVVAGAIVGSLAGLGLLQKPTQPTVPSPGTNNPTQSRRFQAATATDAEFPSQSAYTIMVPEGWVGRPSVERYTWPFGGADFNFTAQDSTGRMKIFFASADFPYYIEPTQDFLNTMNYASNRGCYDPVRNSFGFCASGDCWLACGQYGCYVGMTAFLRSYLSARDYITSVTAGRLQVWRNDGGLIL